MGGLVSRWFIEREGGNRVVRRLIMLGTPNGGSPWPRVQDWATTALAVGLNELSKVIWPASVLAGLVQAVEAVDVTLDQMMPDSGFLRDLHASPDPKIPYLMIAGNTSLIPASAGDEQRPIEAEAAAGEALVGPNKVRPGGPVLRRLGKRHRGVAGQHAAPRRRARAGLRGPAGGLRPPELLPGVRKPEGDGRGGAWARMNGFAR